LPTSFESDEFSSPRTGIEKQGVVNSRENTAFLPLVQKECCPHLTRKGREWGGDIWEKEGDSSRQGDFSPIHCPQERKTLPSVSVGYFPLQLPPTGSSSLGRVVTVVYKKFDFLTALQRLNKKYSFRASSR
jgi:hypothetical protein